MNKTTRTQLIPLLFGIHQQKMMYNRTDKRLTINK